MHGILCPVRRHGHWWPGCRYQHTLTGDRRCMPLRIVVPVLWRRATEYRVLSSSTSTGISTGIYEYVRRTVAKLIWYKIFVWFYVITSLVPQPTIGGLVLDANRPREHIHQQTDRAIPKFLIAVGGVYRLDDGTLLE